MANEKQQGLLRRGRKQYLYVRYARDGTAFLCRPSRNSLRLTAIARNVPAAEARRMAHRVMGWDVPPVSQPAPRAREHRPRPRVGRVRRSGGSRGDPSPGDPEPRPLIRLGARL